MDSIFPKCNKNTDKVIPDQKCPGTLLPLMYPPSYSSRDIGTLIWKCSECGRTVNNDR